MVLSISSAALRCASANMLHPSSFSESILLLYDTITGMASSTGVLQESKEKRQGVCSRPKELVLAYLR